MGKIQGGPVLQTWGGSDKSTPLRERNGDIPVLATFFLKQYCDCSNKRVRGFNSSALESIETYAWPGNIRELENKIQRAVLLSDGPLIEARDLGFDAKLMPQGR